MYKVDARFQKTGKELLNLHGGGDKNVDASAAIPVVASALKNKLQRQNRDKLSEGMKVIFGHEKRKLQKSLNVKKLGRTASRQIQGGRQKVRAIKKRGEMRGKERKREEKPKK